MKKLGKKILALAMAGAMTLSLMACGGGSNGDNAGSAAGESSGADNSSESTSNSVELKKCTIGVALYQDSGPAVTAVKAYLDSLSSTLNVTFSYTVLTVTDESANLTKIQELISSGVDGIICTMDMGTEAILAECEAANVYLAGFLSDYDTSYTTNFDKVFGNEYFLGTVSDGPCVDNLTCGNDTFESVLEYNEANPDAPITHVSLAMFPTWAYPSMQILVDQFIKAAEEYNATAETPIVVDPLNEETDVLQFAPMDSTYFAKHEGINGIVSFAAGSFVYPTMVAAGVDSDIKLFTVGYNEGDADIFGTAGTYQQESVSAVEAINYPLVLLLNKINGVEFSDMPENAERVDSPNIIINSDADMEVFKNSIYCTGNAGDALFTAEAVLNMTAVGNPDATYAGLVESLSHMTIDDLAK